MEEWVLLGGEPLFDLDVERSDPCGIACVYLEGHTHEVFEVFARLMLLDLDAHMSCGWASISGSDDTRYARRGSANSAILASVRKAVVAPFRVGSKATGYS